jgi:hypothetical protein
MRQIIMKLSKKAPTEPGWYWLKWGDVDTEVVKVWLRDNKSLWAYLPSAKGNIGVPYIEAHPDIALWSERIPEPEDKGAVIPPQPQGRESAFKNPYSFKPEGE